MSAEDEGWRSEGWPHLMAEEVTSALKAAVFFTPLNKRCQWTGCSQGRSLAGSPEQTAVSAHRVMGFAFLTTTEEMLVFSQLVPAQCSGTIQTLGFNRKAMGHPQSACINHEPFWSPSLSESIYLSCKGHEDGR